MNKRSAAIKKKTQKHQRLYVKCSSDCIKALKMHLFVDKLLHSLEILRGRVLFKIASSVKMLFTCVDT